MNEQMSMVDAKDKRDAGMELVDKSAADKWKSYADDFILEYLMSNEQLFVDDLWDAGLKVPKSSRALGPRIMTAARKGRIERSGAYRKSVRSNLSEKPVWNSLVYVGKVSTDES